MGRTKCFALRKDIHLPSNHEIVARCGPDALLGGQFHSRTAHGSGSRSVVDQTSPPLPGVHVTIRGVAIRTAETGAAGVEGAEADGPGMHCRHFIRVRPLGLDGARNALRDPCEQPVVLRDVREKAQNQGKRRATSTGCSQWSVQVEEDWLLR